MAHKNNPPQPDESFFPAGREGQPARRQETGVQPKYFVGTAGRSLSWHFVHPLNANARVSKGRIVTPTILFLFAGPYVKSFRASFARGKSVYTLPLKSS